MRNVVRKLALIAVTAGLMLAVASPVFAQSTGQRPTRGDGGLHVSGGGVIGYVGGSGSISGNVVGPNGGDRSTGAVVHKAEPTAVKGGVVKHERISVKRVPASEPVKSSNKVPAVTLLGALAGAAFVLLGRPKANLSP